MWLFVLASTVAILLVIISGLITFARWNFGSLEKQGFTVVKSQHYLLGSAMLSFEKCGGLLDIEHMRKYGPVFGLYEGREPQIFICDPELIRLVTTKDSDHFDAKRPIDFGVPLFNEFLDFQALEKWKTLRSMFSPVVNSSARLKTSMPAMREALNDFIGDVKLQIKKDGKQGKLEQYPLNTNIFGMLTDLIARSQYGMNIGKSDGENHFVQIIKTLLAPPAVEAPWIATYAYAFPFIKKLLPNTLVNPEHSQEFIDILKQMMDVRRQQNKSTGQISQGLNRDYLDILIEWFDDLKTNPNYKRNNITEISLYSLGIILFIAGQDQISLILGVLFYYVSKDQEIERKLHQEVDKIWEDRKGIIDHEALSEMPYLSACITEATRLYPFFFRAERVCTKDWEEPSRGLKIKKGNLVQIALWAANRNPDYFDDPDDFKPERFLPGNKEKLHPYAFTSFGFGPRNCVGKKISIEIMMLLGAYLVKELRFVKRKDTQIKFIPAGPFFGANEPILFDVEARRGSREE